MQILLAIDSSSASEAAVNEVALRPWPIGTTIELLGVIEPAHSWAVSQVVEEVTRRTENLVQRAAERLQSCGLKARPLVLSGDPKAVIVDHAADLEADFVVVGSHGVTGLTRFLLGSVAKAVVRFSPCSVEVVRRVATGGPMKVLLATDGSGCSVLAARSIAERPWPSGAEIRILSVVELGLSTFQAFLEPPFVDSSAMEMLRADAMKHSQDAILAAEQIVTGTGLKASTTVSVLVESPKQIILDEASHWNADLIVVGSHGRRGINRFLLGSVSEAVATHAECSVEVIRRFGSPTQKSEVANERAADD